MNRLRRCNKCLAYKGPSEYSGIHPWCMPCRRASSKASRLKRLEHYRAVNRAWNDRHKEAVERRDDVT